MNIRMNKRDWDFNKDQKAGKKNTNEAECGYVHVFVYVLEHPHK